MSIKGKAYIMGAYEHPLRDAPDKSTPQLHAECAKGALEDAGLTKDDIDGYFCAGDAPGFGAMSMVDYMGLRNVRHMDSTETGGSSYLLHVGHAAQASGGWAGGEGFSHGDTLQHVLVEGLVFAYPADASQLFNSHFPGCAVYARVSFACLFEPASLINDKPNAGFGVDIF